MMELDDLIERDKNRDIQAELVEGLSQIKNFDQFLTESKQQEVKKSVNDKMLELNRALYDLNWIREKRIDGFIMDCDSSRKIRFKDTDDGKDFYIEIVNKSDESFVAEIGSCTSKSIQELIDLVKEY